MFEFAWPWIFLLLPIPWLTRRWLPPASAGDSTLNIQFLLDLQTLQESSQRSSLSHWRIPLRYGLLWLLLLLAAARPQWIGEPLPIAASGYDMMIAVDVSASMDIMDMQWLQEDISRLDLVKQQFGQFIESRVGDRIGLILFGSQAYLQSPLTFDRRTIRQWLEEAQIGIAGKETAIGDAIGLAVKHLREYPTDHRVLILITDGAHTGGKLEPTMAMQLAVDEQVRIHTVGVGADSEQTASIGPATIDRSMQLDTELLQTVATTTGGRFFHARNSEELAAISFELETLEPVARIEKPRHRITALYAWPLGLVLLLSIVWGARQLKSFRWARRSPL